MQTDCGGTVDTYAVTADGAFASDLSRLLYMHPRAVRTIDDGDRLIAWKDQPFAAVIMVNSDNDSVIREVLLAIVSEYELPLRGSE